jgi:prolyl-tRNA editing enzyme YbaK/EbsC (Cys-tRNA(Pro) deacylase)
VDARLHLVCAGKGDARPKKRKEDMMTDSLKTSARRVQKALDAAGMACDVVEMPKTTRTAREAAQAAGCTVGQIVKSLIFKGSRTNKPYLVVASGANRVNEETLAEMVSEPVEMPDADFVREKTGFAIGGVPPLGHDNPLETYIDEDLLQYEEIWAAAGTPNAIFKLTPSDLQSITGGQVTKIT